MPGSVLIKKKKKTSYVAYSDASLGVTVMHMNSEFSTSLSATFITLKRYVKN